MQMTGTLCPLTHPLLFLLTSYFPALLEFPLFSVWRRINYLFKWVKDLREAVVLHAASEALEGMEETIQQRKTRVHTAAVGSTGGVFLVLYLCSTAAWLVVFVVHTSRTPSSSKHVTVIPCLFGTRQACLSTDSDFLPLNNLLLHGKKKKKNNHWHIFSNKN